MYGGLFDRSKVHEGKHISEIKNAWGIYVGLLTDMDVLTIHFTATSCNGLVSTEICNLSTALLLLIIRRNSVNIYSIRQTDIHTV